MQMIYGLLLGTALALADAVLLRIVVKKASASRERAAKIVMRGFAARYLLVVALVVLALLVPAINPVGVVIPLIVQKAVLALTALLPKKPRD